MLLFIFFTMVCCSRDYLWSFMHLYCEIYLMLSLAHNNEVRVLRGKTMTSRLLITMGIDFFTNAVLLERLIFKKLLLLGAGKSLGRQSPNYAFHYDQVVMGTEWSIGNTYCLIHIILSDTDLWKYRYEISIDVHCQSIKKRLRYHPHIIRSCLFVMCHYFQK